VLQARPLGYAAVLAVTINFELPAHFLDGRPQRAGFVLLGAFLLSFLFIRTSARLIRSPKVPWWPGSVVTDSGLHLHHLVWGILLLLLAGFLSFVTTSGSPGTELLAALFGVGAGFTLDEFALWVHLRDVYWAEEGRSSFDAVVVAAMIGALIVLGFAPFDLRHDAGPVEALVAVVVLDVLLAALAIYKGKQLLGLVGIFLPFASLMGAVRLASPSSRWALRFYDPNGKKLARAEARWARIEGRRRRFADAIAGAPEPVAIEPGLAASEAVGHRTAGDD
jgi:hypothetical protein